MALVKQELSKLYHRFNIPEIQIDDKQEFFKIKKRLFNFLTYLNESQTFDVEIQNEQVNVQIPNRSIMVGIPNRQVKRFTHLNINKVELCIKFPEFSYHTKISNIDVFTALIINAPKNIAELLCYFGILFNTVCSYSIHEYEYDAHYMNNDIISKNIYILDRKNPLFEEVILHINDIFNESDLRVMFCADKIDFYPKGTKLLDCKLVEDTYYNRLLDNSRKHFADALISYREQNYISAADNLRKTLEAWLKEVFSLDTTLANILKNDTLQHELKKLLSDKLKLKYPNDNKKVTCQIAYITQFITETFPPLKELLSKYELPHNNGGIKHATATIVNLVDAEIEFMLYQTGAIIRLIDRMLNEEHII